MQSALTIAVSNGEDDTIQIVQGTYSGNFIYASAEAYGVSVEGGYTSGCASREVDPANTVPENAAMQRGMCWFCLAPDQAVGFVVDRLTFRNGNASGRVRWLCYSDEGWGSDPDQQY